jgi:Xaa-Pro dipeptidase
MTEAVYSERARRAAEAVAGAGLAHAVFVSSGRHLFTDMDPVVWLTGFKPMRSAAAVIDSDARVLLYVEGEWEALRAARVGTSAEIISVSAPFERAAAELAGRGVDTVGSAGLRKLNTPEFKALSGAYRLQAVDDELDARARLKDELELAGYREATRIAELAFASLREQLHVGMTDVEAEATIERRLRELGSDDAFVFLSASTRNKAVQRPWGRVLMPGDILLTELSPSVGGVFAQICRTVVFGAPSKALVSDHGLLRGALEQGVRACAAGTTVSEVVAAIDARLIAEGYAEYCKPPFMRVRGHGMGFGSVAPGDFLSRNTLRLQAGDTFVLHPNQALPGAGYLMCGEPVIVGETGGEIVSAGIAPLEIVEA